MSYKYICSVIDLYFLITEEMYLRLNKVIELKQIKKKISSSKVNCICVSSCGAKRNVQLWINGCVQFEKMVSENEDIILIISIIDYLLDMDKNYISLHGSSLTVGDYNYSFLNASGSGKTTAVLKLLKLIKGSQYFADDRLLINQNLFMYGTKNAFSIKEGTKSIFNISEDELLGPFIKDNKYKYWYYKYNGMVDNQIINLNKSKAFFFFLEFNSTIDFEASKLNGSEKAKLFIKNCYNIGKRAKESYIIINKIMNSSEAYRVVYSDDIKLKNFINMLGGTKV